MYRRVWIPSLLTMLLLVGGCTTAYQAKPLPMRAPASYGNALAVEGCTIAAEAFVDTEKTQAAFGFDVHGAGLLPVQVVFDNQGPHRFKIDGGQTFLEDEKGNLWPILDERIAYDRMTRYAQTKKIFSEGAYSGFLGATAGAVIGAAIGIVSGEGVGEAIGKGAAVGAAAGAVMGGMKGAGDSNQARRTIINDLSRKSLENKDISRGLAFGFLFFPAEAGSARELRLQLAQTGSDRSYVLKLAVGPGGGRPSSLSQVSPAAGTGGSAAPAAESYPAVPPPPDAEAGAIQDGPPTPGEQSRCRQWQMVEKRTVSRWDPAAGKYVEVPQEKWDWVDVPCTGGEASPAEPSGATAPPPPYPFPDPPSVAVIPGTYVYVVPDIDVDILFYHGYWYRPFRGHWYWARFYAGPWIYLAPHYVPRVLITLSPGYRVVAREYRRIPYAHLHSNWHRWEKDRYWDNERHRRDYEHRGRNHNRRDRRP